MLERYLRILQKRHIKHYYFEGQRKNENCSMSVIDKDSIRNSIISLVDVLVDQTTQFMDELFPESYPANIFKN